MKGAKFILIAGALLLTKSLAAQEQPSSVSRFLDRLELRQSFGSAGTRNSPVRFQITIPRHEETSFLIDGGVGIPVTNFKIGNSLTMEGKIIGEYHRNTLIDEEQHNWQTGLSGTLRTNIKRNSARTTFRQWSFTPTLKFSRNLRDTASALLFNMDAIPFRSGDKGLNLNTYTVRGNRKLIQLFALNPGIEFQHNFSARQDDNNGTILRPLIKFQYALAGNRLKESPVEMISPDKTWEASFDYTARYAVLNSTGVEEDFTQLMKAGLDYYLLTRPLRISFGVSFNYGSDPALGLKKQHFYLATFSLQK